MKNIFHFIGWSIFLIGPGVTGISHQALADDSNTRTERPHIVFILADDLGYGELGCYGQPQIKTPHLDRLAREGVRLTQHYAGAPVCAPSRCVLLTGRQLPRAEIRGNADSGRGGPFPGQWPLSAESVTLAKLLSDGGYRTGGFGKWGLGRTDSTGSPLRQGFDRFFGYNCQRNAHSYYPPFLDDDEATVTINDPAIPGHLSKREGKIDADDYRGAVYAPTKIMEQAIAFIESSTDRDKPMFLYLPLVEPHLAMQPPQAWIDQYPEEWDVGHGPYRGENGYLPHPRPRAAYAAMISHLDDHVGNILAALERNGMLDNTLFVFTSDNGPTHPGPDKRFFYGGAACDFFDSTGGLRGYKGSCYEGGIRVPCLVRWPGKVPVDSVSTFPSAFCDWLPTLCQAARVDVSLVDHDGVSLLPMFTGGGKPERMKPLMWEFPEYGGFVAIRLGNWKAIRGNVNGPEPGAWELYDLALDSQETTDRAAEHPQIIQQLEAEFLAVRKISTKFPNPVYDSRSTSKSAEPEPAD